MLGERKKQKQKLLRQLRYSALKQEMSYIKGT